MKKIFSIIAIASLVALFASCKNTKTEVADEAQAVDTVEVLTDSVAVATDSTAVAE